MSDQRKKIFRILVAHVVSEIRKGFSFVGQTIRLFYSFDFKKNTDSIRVRHLKIVVL